MHWHRLLRALTTSAIILGCVGSIGCAPKPAASLTRATPYHPPMATIQELMDGKIDPAADALWDSVAFIARKEGDEERQPRTEGDWKAVRDSALTLIESSKLLSTPGRRVAASNREPGRGELSPAEMQRRIDASHAGFVQFAQSLQAAGEIALRAIDARDPQRLMDAGGVIDEACEACHVTYWYPQQGQSR